MRVRLAKKITELQRQFIAEAARDMHLFLTDPEGASPLPARGA